MKIQNLHMVIMIILIFFTACSGNTGNMEIKNSEDKANNEKTLAIEKEIEVSYVAVYLQQSLFTGGNPVTGLVEIPFIYDEKVYLPVRGFARTMNDRDIEWDSEKKELTIGKPYTYPDKVSESYQYKDSLPTQINISYGGITLFMRGEEIPLDYSEQFLIYEKGIYGNADLLCRLFNLKMEWREKKIDEALGDYVYKYLFIDYDLSKDADIQSEWLEANLIYKGLQ